MSDPHRLRAQAAGLRERARALEHRARAVAALVDVRWRSAAATAFRRQVGDRAAELMRTAEAVDAAAEALEAHARAVAEAQERDGGLGR